MSVTQYPAQYPAAITGEQIAHSLAAVRARIVAACARVDRDPTSVRLLPVTKTLPVERLRAAYSAGCTEFGENRVQEADVKAQALADLPIRWSLIGHLQTNKVQQLTRFADEFQALDSLRVAEALERHLQIEGRSLDVFVQVNTSAEDSKFGLAPADVLKFAEKLVAFPALRVRGLMTLAIFSPQATRVRACFKRLVDVQEQLLQQAPPSLHFNELSMGMSGDFEIAIEEGATVVRVGQAIFGARALPDAYYWPGAASGAK